MTNDEFGTLQLGSKIKNSASGNEYYVLGALYQPEGFVAIRTLKIPVDKLKSLENVAIGAVVRQETEAHQFLVIDINDDIATCLYSLSIYNAQEWIKIERN